MWTPILVACGGCYLLKLAGLSVPDRLLNGDRAQRVAALLPVGLLAALTATQTFATGQRLALDARAGGLAVAVVAIAARAPFLVVVGAAAATSALLRLAS
jgi:branched-subunit amino acid transport protein